MYSPGTHGLCEIYISSLSGERIAEIEPDLGLNLALIFRGVYQVTLSELLVFRGGMAGRHGRIRGVA